MWSILSGSSRTWLPSRTNGSSMPAATRGANRSAVRSAFRCANRSATAQHDEVTLTDQRKSPHHADERHDGADDHEVIHAAGESDLVGVQEGRPGGGRNMGQG